MTHIRSTIGLSRFLATAVGVAVLIGAVAGVPATAADARSRGGSFVTIARITDASASHNPDHATLSGDIITLSGTTSRNMIGKVVTVEIRRGHRWVTFAGSARVRGAGTFSIRSRATGVGTQTYRVALLDSGAVGVTASSRSITVWKWYPLVDQDLASDVEPWGGDEPHEFDHESVAGVSYSRLLSALVVNDATSSGDFNLGYHCSTFSSVIGLGDESVTGVTDTFTFFLDGNQADQQTLALGKTAKVSLDVSGTFRIRLQQAAVMPHAETVVDAFPAWPLAEVLCKATP